MAIYWQVVTIKKIIILMLLLIIPTVLALEDCQRDMTESDIPCLIISSWSYDDCNSTQTLVYNTSPELIMVTNFSDYTIGRCNFTWNISTIGTYFWNVSNGDSGRINITHEVDNMASLAIMLFVMAITGLIFWIGYKIDFKNYPTIANNIIKKCCYLGGIWMLLLTITIAVTISSNFGVGAEQILFRLLWFAHKGAWIFTIVLFVTAVFGTLEMYKLQKMKRRMGYE